MYTDIQKEETLKGLVYKDFFSEFGYEPNIGNIDFVITEQNPRTDLFSDTAGSSRHYLWGEAKKGTHDVFNMFTQLLLTCKKTYEKGDHLAPPWLCVFDEIRIAFVPFHDILPIFIEPDFNWTQTPSNHDTPDFKKARTKVENLIAAKMVIFTFGAEDADIHEFIKTHIGVENAASVKSPITKDNFVQIFYRWLRDVLPTINIAKDEWAEYKREGILEGDFFRADVMSSDGNTITEKLKIILESDNYKLQEKMKGRLFSTKIDFTDSGVGYQQFWNRYERPPAEVYHQFIIDRWDLLVPQNIRETKGSFFTPKIWADKSKEYLADVFGENWQDEYYLWDCAAGTGNLLAGLTNEYNIWASDIFQSNVDTMLALIDIDENLNLLPAHVFRFDFLNDSFDAIPAELKKIIDDPEKRKKLIIYINPPYAEAGSVSKVRGQGEHKSEVSKQYKAHDKYKDALGKASNELFSLFMMRIIDEVSGAHLALFSKLKYVNAGNFVKFRAHFSAKFLKGFICCSDTFDNVSGKFPIGFLIWQLSYNGYDFKFPKSLKLDVFNTEGKRQKSKKGFYNGVKYVSEWIVPYSSNSGSVGNLYFTSNDFQHNNYTFISMQTKISHLTCVKINEENIVPALIYFAVRICIEPTWINDRDQFLFPNDGWETDTEFQRDCLMFALFHGQNRISCADGANHWIPFTEKEVKAKEKFESGFMPRFLKGKTFSQEAQAVLSAGKELWKYYHAKIKTNRQMSVNASFYDIREFFQRRNDAGKMNVKSNDETYNALITDLREAQKALAKKIEPKVYEYGFLKE